MADRVIHIWRNAVVDQIQTKGLNSMRAVARAATPRNLIAA